MCFNNCWFFEHRTTETSYILSSLQCLRHHNASSTAKAPSLLLLTTRHPQDGRHTTQSFTGCRPPSSVQEPFVYAAAGECSQRRWAQPVAVRSDWPGAGRPSAGRLGAGHGSRSAATGRAQRRKRHRQSRRRRHLPSRRHRLAAYAAARASLNNAMKWFVIELVCLSAAAIRQLSTFKLASTGPAGCCSSWNKSGEQGMYSHVPECTWLYYWMYQCWTAMYRYVPVCTGIYRDIPIVVYTGMYFPQNLHTSIYRYVLLSESMYQLVL